MSESREGLMCLASGRRDKCAGLESGQFPPEILIPHLYPGLQTIINNIHTSKGDFHFPNPYFLRRISTRVFSLFKDSENAGLSSGDVTGDSCDDIFS